MLKWSFMCLINKCFLCLPPLHQALCIEYRIRENKHELCLSGTFSLLGGSKINNHANAYVILYPGNAIGCYVIDHPKEHSPLRICLLFSDVKSGLAFKASLSM